MHFDIHTEGKSLRDKSLKNVYNKRALEASVLQEVNFLSENPNQLCERLCFIIEEKQAGNDAKRFDTEIVAIFDN